MAKTRGEDTWGRKSREDVGEKWELCLSIYLIGHVWVFGQMDATLAEVYLKLKALYVHVRVSVDNVL